MSTIYGESPEIQLEGEGYMGERGIALYSTDSNSGGTISGGSNTEGIYESMFQIFWTITWDGAETYEGGITGVNWFVNHELSPFNSNISGMSSEESEIWSNAIDDNALWEYFIPWNNKTTSSQKVAFLSYLDTNGASECYNLSIA